MELSVNQKELLLRRKFVVLATADLNANPRAIIVELNKAEGDELIITDNEMDISRNNLLDNGKVFVLAFEENYSFGLKISGKAEYYREGDYFDFVKKLETNKNQTPNGAIVIKIDSIIEFK